MNTAAHLPKANHVTSIGVIFALASGLLLAVAPLELVLPLFALASYALLASITPLAALVFMLVLAPMRTLIATEASLPLPLDIGQITFAGVIGAWVLHRIVRQQPLLHFRWTPLYIPLFAFIGATALTAFTAASLGTMLTEWLKWVIMLIMIALVLDLGRGQRWQWLAFALVLAGAANACVGLYIFFGGSGADHLLILGRFFRAFGTFGQPNPFGGFLGLLTPLAVLLTYGYARRSYGYWRSRGRLQGTQVAAFVFFGSCALLMLAGIVASWSRGAWLSLVVAFAVVAFALPHKLWQSIALASVTLVLAAGLWLSGILPASVVARVSSSTEEFFAFDDVRGVDITSENYAVVERLAHWQAAIFMAEANPWFGIGFGNYEVVYDRYRLINWPEALGHAHNYYLNILGEAGIVGALAYLALWAAVAWVTWRARQHPDPLARAACVGLLGTWAYLATHSFLDNLYVNNLFIHLGTLLGILAVLNQQMSQSHTLRTPDDPRK